MQIRCPVCDYSREADLAKIPPTAEFATCPKCRHRFRFRALDLDEIEKPSPPEPHPEHADVWDAVDSLQERWRERDKNDSEDNGDASHGYDDEAQETPHTRAPQTDIAIPWENPRHLGYWPSFLRTTLWALFQPSSFFATLTTRPALLPALLYYLIFGFLQTACNIIWLRMLVSTMEDQLLERLGEEAFARLASGGLDPSQLAGSLLSVPFHLTLQLFLSAGIIHILLRLTSPRDANFAMAFKIVAYASAALLLIIIPIAGVFLAPLGYLALLFIGCRNAFRLPWSKTLTIVAPLYLMMFFVASLSASQFM